MIDIKKLTKKDIGRWVTYNRSYCKPEKGRIKSWNNTFVFVVYNCADNWENYQDYTAAATIPDNLHFL
jgi:hypothetical protein